MSASEVAKVRQQIQEEYEAAQRGLYGLTAGTARHDFIEAKEEQLRQRHTHLIDLVGPDEAITIIANAIWTSQDQGKTL